MANEDAAYGAFPLLEQALFPKTFVTREWPLHLHEVRDSKHLEMYSFWARWLLFKK